MATDRQIAETVARCVGIIVHYHNTGRAAKDRKLMGAEVQVVAAWVKELDLDDAATNRDIFNPVRQELLARYESKVASDLFVRFLREFEALAIERLARA